jgi:hypothetical protein
MADSLKAFDECFQGFYHFIDLIFRDRIEEWQGKNAVSNEFTDCQVTAAVLPVAKNWLQMDSSKITPTFDPAFGHSFPYPDLEPCGRMLVAAVSQKKTN